MHLNLNDFSNLKFSTASALFAFYLRGNDYGLLQTTCFLTSESLCKAVGGHAWGSLKPEDFIYRVAGPAECGRQGAFVPPRFWQNMPTILDLTRGPAGGRKYENMEGE